MLYFLLIIMTSLNFSHASTDCTASYDALDIPHIETRSLDEYYYCFGLHHARDRAWQMDFFRRTGQGRNAEVLGYQHVKSDLMMRLLDLPALASRIWKEFSVDKKRDLEHYSQGVNAGFKEGKLGREFKELGYSPETWKPEHSILVLLLQSFDQTRKTFTTEVDEEKRKNVWGDKAKSLFGDEDSPWLNTILKDGEYTKTTTHEKSSSVDIKKFFLWSDFPTVFGEMSGSNNWVISKKKSKSGFAILANDPHLDLKTPMFWYWISIKTPKGTAMGGSLAGVPVLANGTNGKVAWGLTNSYINTADVVAVSDLKPELIEQFRPWIKVKLGFLTLPFFFKSFERLTTGQRILPLETDLKEKLLLKWSGFSLRATDLYPIFDLFLAEDVTSMNEILSRVGIPSWNYVFADTNGDIGYRMVGKVFRQTLKSSYGIPVKTLEEFKQEEFLLPQENPWLLKPARNYIYTANNRHWPRDSIHYGGRAYSPSFRGFEIDDKLQSDQDVKSLKKLQCDRHALDAYFFIKKLSWHIEIKELKNWSIKAEDNSISMSIYRRMMDITMKKWGVNEQAFFRLLDDLNQKQKDELRIFLKEAREDIQQRPWSKVLRAHFPHMSKIESLNFSPEIAGVGDLHSIDPGTSEWNADKKIYQHFSGASMRMIIELSKPPQILLILPGHNRNYSEKKDNSVWERWRSCEYTKLKI